MTRSKGGEMEKRWPEIRLAVKELSLLQDEDQKAPTMAFLCVSKLLVHVLDKIGPTMVVLREDMQRNIERVEEIYLSNPSIFSSLEEVLQSDVDSGLARKGDSFSKAVLWLARSLHFSLTLLEQLVKDSDTSLALVVEETYQLTIKPWHGWISRAAYKVAMKLIPEREDFVALLMRQGQDYDALKSDIKEFVSLFKPLLDEVQAILKKFRLDRLKST
ncbi:Glycolipid transfer protein [Dioscorea alata]|uniref:Glycolipid transfer protein n=1 Tax=Dioscorea alata TaxID=55571 RepID=A0ACB7USY5_DIOAL|nr:Glycolipid transfer protein [Dioscorea alata]